MFTRLVKNGFRLLGLNIERRDPLEETIPASYEMSQVLPRVYKQSLERIFYFQAMLEKISEVEGDVVECGTSIGHGLLYFALIGELIGVERPVYGFDSFEGFPSPSSKDSGTHAYKGFYSNPPEIVLKVLADGRVSEKTIRERVHLVKGFFDKTVAEYDGRIALLHLDCDLYESYKVCLDQLYNRVVPGGVILFDEYDVPSYPGATKAIDEFFAEKDEAPCKHDCGKYYIVKDGF